MSRSHSLIAETPDQINNSSTSHLRKSHLQIKGYRNGGRCLCSKKTSYSSLFSIEIKLASGRLFSPSSCPLSWQTEISDWIISQSSGWELWQNRKNELLKSNDYLWPLKSQLLVTAVRYKTRKVSTGTSGAEMENSLKAVLQLPCMVMSL